MNEFGYNLSQDANDVDRCTTMLSQFLNRDKLALYLGAGASASIGLPGWEKLVRSCIAQLPASAAVTISSTDPFDPKLYSKRFKKACEGDKYLKCIHSGLYEGVSFNFNGVRKEMLIALTSLMVGKVRGNVRKIVTLNFDDVLEWYLETNGLRVHVLDKVPLHSPPADVEVLHLHGFLPFDSKRKWSDFIVFTDEEFKSRERGNDYEKRIMEEFYKNHIFLGIGLSPETIVQDIAPYLEVLRKEWYQKEGIVRGFPFGYVFIDRCTPEQQEDMLDHGIVPCLISNREEIPTAIFEIAQKSAHGKH